MTLDFSRSNKHRQLRRNGRTGRFDYRSLGSEIIDRADAQQEADREDQERGAIAAVAALPQNHRRLINRAYEAARDAFDECTDTYGGWLLVHLPALMAQLDQGAEPPARQREHPKSAGELAYLTLPSDIRRDYSERFKAQRKKDPSLRWKGWIDKELGSWAAAVTNAEPQSSAS